MQSEFIGMKFDLNNSLSMLKLALAHKIHNFQALSFPNNPKSDSTAEFMIMEKLTISEIIFYFSKFHAFFQFENETFGQGKHSSKSNIAE